MMLVEIRDLPRDFPTGSLIPHRFVRLNGGALWPETDHAFNPTFPSSMLARDRYARIAAQAAAVARRNTPESGAPAYAYLDLENFAPVSLLSGQWGRKADQPDADSLSPSYDDTIRRMYVATIKGVREAWPDSLVGLHAIPPSTHWFPYDSWNDALRPQIYPFSVIYPTLTGQQPGKLTPEIVLGRITAGQDLARRRWLWQRPRPVALGQYFRYGKAGADVGELIAPSDVLVAVAMCATRGVPYVLMGGDGNKPEVQEWLAKVCSTLAGAY